MGHGLLDPASLQRMLYDTLDHSDDIVLVLEQTGDDGRRPRHRFRQRCVPPRGGHRLADLIGQPFHALVGGGCRLDAAGTGSSAPRGRQDLPARSCCAAATTARTFWFGFHLMQVRGPPPAHFVVLGRDITESLQARQQQAAIQGLLAKVFLCVQAPVAIVSENGIIQMSNPALEELLGYPAGGLVGKRAIDCNAPGDRPAAVAARQRQTEDGHDYSLPTRLSRADGTELPVVLTSITVQREDLRRFRIITVLPRPSEPPATVHVAGKIRLIGLDEVKEALGSRWAAVAARAMASAEHVIRRRCGPHDTLFAYSGRRLPDLLRRTTEEEAGFRAAALAREIRTRLVGDGETEATANVSAIAAAVDVPYSRGGPPTCSPR